MDRAETWLVHTAGSPVTFVVVFVLLAVGVIVIFLPSESLVVAVAALLLARPDRLVLVPTLVVTAALGLAAGDLLLFAIARRWDRRKKKAAHQPSRLDALRSRLARRVTDMRDRFSANPLTTMIFMRLVPAGRASSDVVAAELGLTTRRFLTYALAGGLVYGVYCTAIAAVAYPLVQKYPIPSTIGAIVLAVALSSVVDRIDQAVRRRRAGSRSSQTT